MKKALWIIAAVTLSSAAYAQENCYLTAYFYTPMLYLSRPSQLVKVSTDSVGQCVDSAFEQKLFELTRDLEGPPGHLYRKTVKSIHFGFRAVNGDLIQGEIQRPSK